MPKLSVVLPVYNGAAYLAEAVESILAQEEADLELIIINDGSTDDSQAVIDRFTDQRIRSYQQKNQGLAATLNRGIELAKGDYIARHDQDDLAHPARLRRQLAFLEAHPDYGLIGTWASVLEENGPTYRYLRHPTDNGSLHFSLLFNNPFVHSSVMFRPSVVAQAGGYSTDPKRQPPEDYELWSRLGRLIKIANVPIYLQQYRATAGGMSRDAANPYMPRVIERSIENITDFLSKKVDKTAVAQLATLVQRPLTEAEGKPLPLAVIRQLLQQLTDTASQLPDTNPTTLAQESRQIWYAICSHYPLPAPVRAYYWLAQRIDYRMTIAQRKEQL